jgi:hypothetical protein
LHHRIDCGASPLLDPGAACGGFRAAQATRNLPCTWHDRIQACSSRGYFFVRASTALGFHVRVRCSPDPCSA